MTKLIPILALSVVLSFAQSLRAAGSVKLTQEPTVIKVEIDGKPFTTYWYADGNGREYVRPFFYPVLASDGTPVTADQNTSKEHPHHRSMWVSHGDVNGADHWAYTQKPSPKQRHVKFDKVEGDTIVQQLVWESKDLQPMLNETRTFRFFAYPDGSRGVDFTSSFTPVSGPVTFGDTKEAGLCSVRVAKSISDKPTLTNSASAVGEKSIWGKKAAWCDLSGMINGKPYGIAILDHPTNHRHPTEWHAREYGLLSANPFGLHDYTKGVAKGTGNLTMQPGTTTTFRHRVVIHPGDAKAANLDEKFKDFAAGK
jgi:hypothetical protein